MQTISPHMLSKVPLLNNNFSNFSDLIYNSSISFPNNKKLCPSVFQNMLIIESNKNKTSTDEMLFSLFLQSRSPSYSFKNDAKKGALTSKTLSSGNINVHKIVNINCTQSTQDATEPPINQPKIKKPRIILQVHPPQTKSQPKIIIQLKEPQKQPLKKPKSKSKPISKIRLRIGKPRQSTWIFTGGAWTATKITKHGSAQPGSRKMLGGNKLWSMSCIKNCYYYFLCSYGVCKSRYYIHKRVCYWFYESNVTSRPMGHPALWATFSTTSNFKHLHHHYELSGAWSMQYKGILYSKSS